MSVSKNTLWSLVTILSKYFSTFASLSYSLFYSLLFTTSVSTSSHYFVTPFSFYSVLYFLARLSPSISYFTIFTFSLHFHILLSYFIFFMYSLYLLPLSILSPFLSSMTFLLQFLSTFSNSFLSLLSRSTSSFLFLLLILYFLSLFS